MKEYIVFDVKASGKIVNVKLMKGCQFDCVNRAVLDVVNRMPNFVPGMVNGKKVWIQKIILPVSFKF